MSDEAPTYDAAVVLGSRPVDGGAWELPEHVYHSLDRAVALYRSGRVRHIVVSGKWTFNFDILGIRQPFTEGARMAEYLGRKGVPARDILCETVSKDAISNLYYLKREIFGPAGLRRLIFIAAGPRLARIEFLSRRILGADFVLTFETDGRSAAVPTGSEQRRLALQAAFLEPMRDGDEGWLDGRFYNGPYYDEVRASVLHKAAQEPYIRFATVRHERTGR